MTSIDVRGVSVPAFFYGTAWKEERTASLTQLALQSGFRAIDTANQRKHYVEAAVGEAVAAAGIPRRELFLQTKFTYVEGQDQRLPYDPEAAPAEQVRQSFERSLQHLQTDVIDSYVLHGPSRRVGLAARDWEVWRAMEALQRDGRARMLGVSNVSLEQLRALVEDAAVLPAMVQNRCFASTGWDADVRAFCRRNDIRYQGFSLLTANVRYLRQPAVLGMAEKRGCTLPQLVFRFALALDMIVLTGTSDAQHMREDLACADIELSAAEIATLEHIAD